MHVDLVLEHDWRVKKKFLISACVYNFLPTVQCVSSAHMQMVESAIL